MMGAGPSVPSGPPPKRDPPEDRFVRQNRESRKVLTESADILKTVSDKLERAARELGEYGDYPLRDLERNE